MKRNATNTSQYLWGKWMMISLCILLISSCTKAPIQTSLPNILLIVSEDNGPDLGCYGVQEVTTPHLDRLASEGVRFEYAFVPYSVCSPSRSTLFTGLYPHQNGQIGLATHKYRMHDSLKTLPVYLKEAGLSYGLSGQNTCESPRAYSFRLSSH